MPTNPSSAVSRSHQARQRPPSTRRAASAALPSKRGCDRRDRDRQEHERIVVGTAKMQQPGFAHGSEQDRRRSQRPPPGRPKAERSWASVPGVVSRTRSAKKPTPPDKTSAAGAPIGRRVEQVLPGKAAGFLANIEDVESRARSARSAPAAAYTISRSRCATGRLSATP